MILRYLAKFFTAIAFIFTILGVFIIFIFFYYGRDLPEYAYLQTYEPPSVNRFYSKDFRLFREIGTEKRLFCPLESIPPLLIKAYLAAEDRNFYYHFGMDFWGMARAALSNTLTQNWQNRPGGASTITQQVAKNFLLGNQRSFNRKIREAIMSLRLESALPKDKIIELYLNQIYLGTGVYGVSAAALVYFNKLLCQLTVDEIAFLAALPKAPSSFTNKKKLSRVKIRRNWVIDRMVSDGIISSQAGYLAKKKPLELMKNTPFFLQPSYFSEEARKEATKIVGPKAMEQGGLSIFTTLDLRLQKIAEQTLRKGLVEYDRRHGWRGPLDHKDILGVDCKKNIFPVITHKGEEKPQWLVALLSTKTPKGIENWEKAIVLQIEPTFVYIGLEDGSVGVIALSSLQWARPCLLNQWVGPAPKTPHSVVRQGDVILVDFNEEAETYELQQIPKITGGLVVISPSSGRVLAVSGGFHFDHSPFNCATQALRQPGSTFKPFVYLTALEKGFKPDTLILDAPISISLGGGRGYYTPQNYTHQFYGPCPLRIGIEQSRNVMTVRLAQRVGMRSISKTADAFNIMNRMPCQLAMALGAGETTLLKLTAAYASLANGGYKTTPAFIESIQNNQGKTLFQHIIKKEDRLASAESVHHMVSMLEGVIQRGTARSLKELEIPIAGKTGTTNDYKDAWFIGFTHDLVVGVFLGFPSPKTMGKGETGGRLSVPVFKNFVKRAKKNKIVFPLNHNKRIDHTVYSIN